MTHPLFDNLGKRARDLRSKQERFAEFDREHPRVYELFCEYVDELLDAGVPHYSADHVLHRVRWHTVVGGKYPNEFKINDHFTALYARKWLREHPQHAGFFRLRRRRSA